MPETEISGDNYQSTGKDAWVPTVGPDRHLLYIGRIFRKIHQTFVEHSSEFKSLKQEITYVTNNISEVTQAWHIRFVQQQKIIDDLDQTVGDQSKEINLLKTDNQVLEHRADKAENMIKTLIGVVCHNNPNPDCEKLIAGNVEDRYIDVNGE